MYRSSPTLLFLYLPWVAGVTLMLVMLGHPLILPDWDDNIYLVSPSSPCTPDSLIQLVSISPRFPGCKNLPDRDECAHQRLEDYLYNRVTYPADPHNKYDAGLVVINFIVRPSGRISEINLMREPGYGRGADALRIIRGMVKEEFAGKLLPSMAGRLRNGST